MHPRMKRVGETSRSDVRIEKIEIQPEPGVTVPGLLFVRSGEATQKRGVLYLNPAGKDADATGGGEN